VDPYVRACRDLEEAGVRYIIVGAFGVDLYARDAGCIIRTLDCDLLLPADPVVLGLAVAVLKKLGYSMQAGGEPVDQDPELLRGIVRARGCIRAVRKGARIDLPLQIEGCRFQALWKKHRRIEVGGVRLRVAPLRDILRSKKLANRPKDRLFLAAYQDALRQLLEPPPRRR
jgi:hypothetical protein